MVDRLAMVDGATYHLRNADLARSLVRAAGLAAALVLIATALVLGRDWLNVIGPPRLYPTAFDRLVSGGVPGQLSSWF